MDLAPERRTSTRTVRRASYKRGFDLLLVGFFTVALLPLWLPAWIIVALLVLVVDGWPIFVVQERLGRDGRVFRMVKFRTMVRDAEAGTGPVMPSRDDPRATRLGRLLRRTSLDEAPQVLNILRGEMSIVGPRPERPELAARIRETVPDYDLRLAVPPGIAGLDHIRGDRNYRSGNYRNRLRYDLFYIQRASPRLDVVIMAWSVWVIIARLAPGCGGRRT